MEGKRPQESSLGARAMRHEPLIFEESVDFGPEIRKSRRSRKVPRADTMNFLGSPSDGLVGKQKAGEAPGNCEVAHQRDTDLHGHLGTATANACALEVNGGKRRLGNTHCQQAVPGTKAAKFFQRPPMFLGLE